MAETLARLNQEVAGLDDETQRLTVSQAELTARRRQLHAQRIALSNVIAQRLANEADPGRRRRPPPPRRVPPQPTAPPGQTAPPQRTATSGPTPPPQFAAYVDLGTEGETSSRSVVNTLLALGGVLLGLAAIGVYYTAAETGGRAFILALATTLALGVPVLLARRTLTATAETIAAVGLLLVLLDGYVAYTADLAGVASVSEPLFAAILFALVAGVATAYRLATHLRAPQFAALLAVQPLLPLLAVHFELGRDGFAAVFAGLAAQNLAAVSLLSRTPRSDRYSAWPRMLRELAWALAGLALATAGFLATVGLIRAASVAEAVRAAGALMVAAAVGVVMGQMSARLALRRVATGAATLAIIASVTRVEALALPQYALVLTAALAAGIALVSGLLPAELRMGPRLGSLIAAGLTSVVVVAGAVRTAVATSQAATTPVIWAADLTTERLPVVSWQVPAAAILLTVVAAAATPGRWRIDSIVLGGFVAILAAPGAATLPWWAPALLGAVASPLATVTAFYATTWRSALLRSSTAGLLGLYAVVTSLARPELTAGISTLLALVAAAAAVVAGGWPERLGPYADRVGDAATGAAAFTLPIAIGSYAYLLGAPPAVLLPLTMLGTALGILAAALSQVGAQLPRTGSAGGALAAAVGCVLLSIQLPGTTAADIMLGLLLLGAAAATAASRAFEASPGGLVEVAHAVPAAVRAFTEALGGDNEVDPRSERQRQGRFGGPRGLRIDGITLGAAAATAALIGSMARLLAVAVPGVGLVTTTAMVFVTSLGVPALPEAMRRGPRLGGGAVAGAIGLFTAGLAVVEATRTLAAGTPWWHADLATWSDRISTWAPYGWQVSASLILAAAASVALLPAPQGGDVGFVALSLAGLAAPAALGLAWWSPVLIAGLLAVAAGVGAALLGPDDAVDVAHRRLGLAAVLGLYAAAAAAATPAATSVALGGIVGAGVLVAAVAHLRMAPPPVVAGVATAAALVAAPGAAATIAVIGGATRQGVLGSAMSVAAFGVFVLVALRTAGVRWLAHAVFGVGAAALIVPLSVLPDLRLVQPWAALAALVATAAAATLISDQPATSTPREADGAASSAVSPGRGGSGDTDRRAAALMIATTAAPAAALAAIASAPAWLTALFGPYRTLQQIWQGHAVTPVPRDATIAVVTLALLVLVGAGISLTLGGRDYLLATVLPPLAALALVAPTAMGAPQAATPWVAIAIALATGLGAALVLPRVPSATRLLRGTAGVVCALTGAAGIAGSLATRADTLAALAVVHVAAVVAATAGRDPAVRMVAWIVAAAAALAFPVTAYAAAGWQLRPSAFWILAICAVLVGVAFALARRSARRAEAPVVEMCAYVGAAFALLLTLDSTRHCAAVLTIWGLLLGEAALRPDRSAQRRLWLVRAALAAELGAAWLLLYTVEVGLPEAYTLPFALVALLTGALELRRRPDLSSWLAYGPALAGGFLPSLALVLVGDDPLWRWVTLFAAAIVTVIVGSWRRRRAPVVSGSTVAVAVALTEMVRLLIEGEVAGAILVAVAGLVLIGFGAMYEQRLRGALRRMS